MNRSKARRAVGIVVTAAAVVMLAACGGAGGSPDRTRPADGDATVVQQAFRFIPPSLRVAAGMEVTWVNRDTVDHTVTSGIPGDPDGWFDRPLGKEATIAVGFAEPGTYAYFCSIHNSMRGEIVVG